MAITRSICLLMTLAIAVCGRDDIKANAVRVDYGSYILFSTGGDTYAFHILADPRYGSDGITYTWYWLPGGGSDFFVQGVEVGNGETHEVRGMGALTAGPLTLEWLKSALNAGWLYWRDAAPDIAVYLRQFRQLEDAKATDAEKWIARSSLES